jgi:hypothetical protein
MAMSGDAGGAIAPLVSGLVQVRTGFTPLFWGTMLVYTLGLIAVYGFFVRPASGATDNGSAPTGRNPDGYR